ncbi:MAG: hypothetical protein JWO19_3423 [Bryobacterales bacterium]|nr:hypothetical protein [Bryobacterales bacterium]
MKLTSFRLIAGVCFSAAAWAQITPLASAQVGLSRSNIQSAKVRGDGTVTNIIVPVTSTPTDDDLLDILASDSVTQISIVLPDGTQIVPTDGATSNGLAFDVYAIPSDSTSNDLITLMLPGNHVVVEFSTAAPIGAYIVRATRSGTDSSITVVHTPFSGVSVAAVTDSPSYRQGDLVVLSALVFNGTTPVTQASVQATIGAFVPVSGTIGNYQQTDQQQIDSTYTRYTYTEIDYEDVSHQFYALLADPDNKASQQIKELLITVMSRGVIPRDIHAANFIRGRRSKTLYLVDFNLIYLRPVPGWRSHARNVVSILRNCSGSNGSQ